MKNLNKCYTCYGTCYCDYTQGGKHMCFGYNRRLQTTLKYC
jgi:hypothetical protein